MEGQNMELKNQEIEFYRFSPRIYILKFPSQFEMNLCCFRISEGPEYSFIELIKREYKKTGQFNFLTNWNGFCLTEQHITRFLCNQNHITEAEQSLFRFFQKLKFSSKLCIICLYKKETFIHEFYHAILYFNSQQKKRIIEKLSQIQIRFPIEWEKMKSSVRDYIEEDRAEEIAVRLLENSEKGRKHLFLSQRNYRKFSKLLQGEL